MSKGNQTQKASDNAQQVQVQTINVINGIDEKRAREIYSEMSQKAIEECTFEATIEAQARVNRFAEELIPRIEKIERDFKSFSDPSFQVLLKKAQITAACTDRELDYKLLAELLVHRVNNRENIKKKASIEKAVEIVDKIDDDALCALTVYNAMVHVTPVEGEIYKGIRTLSGMYNSLSAQNLPNDDAWIDNLSILNAIHYSYGRHISFFDHLKERIPGYCCVGIKKDSDNYKKAEELFLQKNLDPSSILIDNELLDGYVRLKIAHFDRMHHLTIDTVKGTLIVKQRPMTQEEMSIFNTVHSMYSNDQTSMKQAERTFNSLLRRNPVVLFCMNWFDKLNCIINTTSIGKAIAHANAKRMYASFPDMD